MAYHITIDTDLKRNPYKGLYIALEGIDGSGKSTQVKKIQQYFENQNREVFIYRWPRKTEGIFKTITSDVMLGNQKIPTPALQYIFSADFVIFSEETLIPALEQGKVVIADRCHFWSAAAYYVWDNDERYTDELMNSLLVTHGVLTKGYQFIVPDITFYLSLTLQTAMHRLPERENKDKEVFESESSLQKVQKAYTKLVNEFPEEFTIIDAERSIEEVTTDMVSVINKYANNPINKSIKDKQL